MPTMGLEAKIVVGLIVALLIGAIAAYHLWLDRRQASRQSAAPPAPAGLRATTPRSSADVRPPAPSPGGPPPGSSARRTQ